MTGLSALTTARYELIILCLLVCCSLSFGVPACKGPGKIVNLTMEPVPSKKVRLSWAAPQSPSSCAQHYDLSYCSTFSYWPQSCNYTSLILPLNTSEVLLHVEPCKYTHVTLTTVGDNGTSSQEAVLISPRVEHPEPPVKLAVEVVNSTTFSLSWEDAAGTSVQCRVGYRICLSTAGLEDDYNCVFQQYQVSYPDTRSKWTNNHSPTSACTNYTLSVASVYNSLDLDGVASDTSAVTFHTAPDHVANLKINSNQTAISLEWSMEVSKCAEHHIVSWCNVPYPWYAQCRAENRSLTTNETSFKITGLTACSYYWVSVSTEGEDGLRSETKNLVITPPVEDEVRHLDVMYDHGSQFAAAWDVVGGDACVSSYRVCWRGEGLTEECDHSRLNNYESLYNLSLETCSNYTLDVASLDVFNGTSENATAHFATGPDNVADLYVSRVEAHSALVRWQPSPSNCADQYELGSCSTAYPAEPCNPTNTISVNTTVTRYNMTGLEPCTYTVISIRTRTADGRSSGRREKIVKTRLGDFDPPEKIVLTAFSARLFSLEYRAASSAVHCTEGYVGCFKETGSAGEPVCLSTNNQQYWSNSDNATRACTKYDVQFTALSDDKRTWNISKSFTSPTDEVQELQVTNGTTGPNGSSVVVTWKVSPDNGCMTHQYLNCSRVEVMGNDHAPTVLWSMGANLTNDVTQYEISNLEPCSSYTINVFQEPTPLDPIPTEILFHTASNVTSVTFVKVVATDDHSVNISYLAPEVSARCVSKYYVCWRQTDGVMNDTCMTRRGSGVQQVYIDGLESCAHYQVSVTPVAPSRDKYTTANVTAATAGCKTSTTTNTTTTNKNNSTTTSMPTTPHGGSVLNKASLFVHCGVFLLGVLLFQ